MAGPMIPIGSPNPPLSKHEFSLELTAQAVSQLHRGWLALEGLTFIVKKAPTSEPQVIEVTGNLPSENYIQKIQELQSKGWSFDGEACKYYHLEF